MRRHLAGATIQVANLVKYKCHSQEDDNKFQGKCLYKKTCGYVQEMPQAQISVNSEVMQK